MVHGLSLSTGATSDATVNPAEGRPLKSTSLCPPTKLCFDPAVTREMPAFGTETILLVDDDDHIREMGRQMIEMGGYKVLIARSGEEALEIYATQREHIALVILDLIMPGMGGSRCLEELVRIDPDVRVLIASGYSSNGLAQGQQGIAARGFVSKPYDAKGILTAIRKVLDDHPL